MLLVVPRDQCLGQPSAQKFLFAVDVGEYRDTQLIKDKKMSNCRVCTGLWQKERAECKSRRWWVATKEQCVWTQQGGCTYELAAVEKIYTRHTLVHARTEGGHTTLPQLRRYGHLIAAGKTLHFLQGCGPWWVDHHLVTATHPREYVQYKSHLVGFKKQELGG